MDPTTKKTVLRMIPYGIYVMTAQKRDGSLTAATVNWVTQTAFDPPLLVVGVKVDSGAYAAIRETGQFALNMLGKGQKDTAFTFFKPALVENGRVSGEAFRLGDNGAPILDGAMAAIECKVIQTVEAGDHHVVVGEVTQAHLHRPPEGRPDDAILAMRDLGDTIFYGG